MKINKAITIILAISMLFVLLAAAETVGIGSATVAPGGTASPLPPIIVGDVNGDGGTNIVDALLISQYTIGLRTLTSTQLAAADVNGDGQVNIVDALFIAQYTVGLRTITGAIPLVSSVATNPDPVSVGSATIALGGTATVPIRVTSVTTDIAAATVRIAFNPAVVTVSAVNQADLTTIFVPNINNVAGTVDISIVSPTAATTAPVTIANVVLQAASGAASGATSPLTLTVQTLSDSNGVNRVPGAGGITNGLVTIGTTTIVTILDAGGSSSISGATSSMIPASIIAKNVQNLGAATITLTYDPSVVTVQSVSAGNLGTPTSNINNVAGTTQISAFTLTGKSGNVTIANLELKVVGSTGATSPLTLSVSAFSDSNASPISHTASSGQLSVVQYLRGDMNCDGKVDIVDALLIAQYSVGLRPTPYTC